MDSNLQLAAMSPYLSKINCRMEDNLSFTRYFPTETLESEITDSVSSPSLSSKAWAISVKVKFLDPVVSPPAVLTAGFGPASSEA